MIHTSMTRIKKYNLIGLAIFICHFSAIGQHISQSYNILDYGAKADSITINTQAIQKVIDICYDKGGGIVIIPNGIFITGTLQLKDNITLHLEKMAVLRASIDTLDFPGGVDTQSLIYINQAKNVSVNGEGTIDGRGSSFIVNKSNPDNRPNLILVRDCKNIRIEDVTLKNSAYWTLRLQGNEHVFIKGISIYSHANLNNDGIDIDSKDVVISDCIIDTDDDALCFKSSQKTPCENVVVTNCIIASNCNFIKMGTMSRGGFKNITISNCVLRPASESNFRAWNKNLTGITDSITGISGIALEVVDGGFLDQVSITNISMEGVQTPVFIRLGSRENPTGSLKNVLISNIIATTKSLISSSITAVPGFYVENVILRNIIINCKGGGTLSDINRSVPEVEKNYPENRMFGNTLPAYGLYVRHARNITLDNVQFKLLQPDARFALWLEDSHDITIKDFKTSKSQRKNEIIKKIETSGIIIR
jgi:polygalacturonase